MARQPYGNLKFLAGYEKDGTAYNILLMSVRAVLNERVTLMPFLPEDVLGRHIYLGGDESGNNAYTAPTNGHDPLRDCRSEDEREMRVLTMLRGFFDLAVHKGDMIIEPFSSIGEYATSGYTLKVGGLLDNPEIGKLSLFKGNDDVEDADGEDEDAEESHDLTALIHLIVPQYIDPDVKLEFVEQRIIEKVILDTCAEQIGLTSGSLIRSKNITKRLMHARQFSIYLIRELAKRPFETIAKSFPSLNVARTITLYEQLKLSRARDPELSDRIDSTVQQIFGRLKQEYPDLFKKLLSSS